MAAQRRDPEAAGSQLMWCGAAFTIATAAVPFVLDEDQDSALVGGRDGSRLMSKQRSLNSFLGANLHGSNDDPGLRLHGGSLLSQPESQRGDGGLIMAKRMERR